jgi:hypothetical protein
MHPLHARTLSSHALKSLEGGVDAEEYGCGAAPVQGPALLRTGACAGSTWAYVEARYARRFAAGQWLRIEPPSGQPHLMDDVQVARSYDASAVNWSEHPPVVVLRFASPLTQGACPGEGWAAARQSQGSSPPALYSRVRDAAYAYTAV